MEYLGVFNTISLGTIVLYSCAIGFLGGVIYRFLERYRKTKNELDEKKNAINEHESKIQQLNEDVQEVSDKVDKIANQIQAFNDIYDQREARRLRREILKFSDNLREGRVASKDAFEDIFESNEAYLTLIAKKKIPNGFTEREMVYINKCYDNLYGN